MNEWHENIVDRMKRGEAQAFEQCYQCWSSNIYTVISQICNEPACVEDIMQDTFISAFENIHSFKPQYTFIAWLKRIAFNKTINVLNKEKVKRNGQSELKRMHIEALSQDHSYEQENLLSYLFKDLPSQERLILWLFIVEQYSHREIADLVGRSTSYSKSIVSRSLKKLREKYGRQQYACL
ncbi:sigma-70 family RNA polymerase sigma factor [Thalassotalea sp. G2M2-11]|uniref:RNA polymerase sigma factor n=1 Tax=Thalassotalea sp. G2M2-11 TaxID=2787627 RepID=UPI0019D01D04|nr:sigma-70 family RNA polymerase sigma factor [Thalassotalea sp. G2M2-11]